MFIDDVDIPLTKKRGRKRGSEQSLGAAAKKQVTEVATKKDIKIPVIRGL